MQQYHDTVEDVLLNGSYKPNRTGVSTISGFSKHYTIDLQEGYPLLTTKKMDGYRWNSMLHELFWYLSGEEHIRNLREETKIWDAWADDDGNLDTAYGRFWRRYPHVDHMVREEGESWAKPYHNAHNEDEHTFDQIQYVIDTLKENPQSRRMVVNAWHPANAAVSSLPPCHFSFVFNVQGDRLNCHLTQRSADLALGVPFNIACYALLTKIIAQETGFEPGTFSHTLVDAHVYCGEGDRAEWYEDNWDDDSLKLILATDTYGTVKRKIEEEAPPDPDNLDHVPGLLEQLGRDPLDRPTIEVADKPLDDLTADDVELTDYESYAGISFGVAT